MKGRGGYLSLKLLFSLAISDSSFSFKNFSTVYSLTEISLTNIKIDGNSVYDYGGGLYTYNSDVIINDVLITDNSAEYGGGIYSLEYSDIQMNRVLIADNDVSSQVKTQRRSKRNFINYRYWKH